MRIMDVEYGADSDEDGWTEREAGTAVQKDRLAEDFDPNSMRDRLYRVGVCFPLGYIEDGSFKKAKSIPQHFSSIRRAGPEDYGFLRSLMGDVEIGKLRSGDRIVDFPVGHLRRFHALPRRGVRHHRHGEEQSDERAWLYRACARADMDSCCSTRMANTMMAGRRTGKGCDMPPWPPRPCASIAPEGWKGLTTPSMSPPSRSRSPTWPTFTSSPGRSWSAFRPRNTDMGRTGSTSSCIAT